MAMRRFNPDFWGACASSLCAAHCLLFPLFSALVPTALLALSDPAEVAAESLEPEQRPRHDATGGEGQVLHCADCCCDPSSFYIHAGMLCITLPLAAWALRTGYLSHRRIAGLLAGGLGLLLLTAALAFEAPLAAVDGAFWLTMAGSALLVSAHLWNWSRCAGSRCGAAQQAARAPLMETIEV